MCSRRTGTSATSRTKRSLPWRPSTARGRGFAVALTRLFTWGRAARRTHGMAVAFLKDVTVRARLPEDPVAGVGTTSKEPVPSRTEQHLSVTRKILAATVPPLIAFAVEAIFWSVLSPFVSLLFYPAVFISAWLGGRASGIGAALISTGIAAWYFIPPERTLAVEGRYIPVLGVFAAMSIAFVEFHERLRRAHRDAAAALAASEHVNERLNQAANERRIFGRSSRALPTSSASQIRTESRSTSIPQVVAWSACLRTIRSSRPRSQTTTRRRNGRSPRTSSSSQWLRPGAGRARRTFATGRPRRRSLSLTSTS